MADPRFFRAAGPFTVGEVARATGCEIGGAARTDLVLDDVAPLETAGPSHLSFLANPRYGEAFAASSAGAVCVLSAAVAEAPSGATLLISSDPYRAFARAARLFYPATPVEPGIASSAVIAETARIGDAVAIGHHAVIEAGAEIGAGTSIGIGSVVGAGVVIGADCRIAAHVTLSHCLIGDRVTLYPGVRIGQDGFGFAPGRGGHEKVPQLGRVIVEDDVEIGANATIDRGALPDTTIGAGSMIDNLVQIGHNVVIGRGCVLVAQTGISGSTRLGDFVMVGGQGGLAGHLTIGDGARIGAKSGVMRDIPPGTTVGGIPAVPVVQWHRQTAMLERLVKKKDKQP
ncbi:MAG TPA: UDP-3-O-(3-hydroxymyristoyl)glucosamine N-acyltransferase [Stellaceae bacterium]|nr:UDP-3-O-(3-hydroxymyristoyl)glucosamine N-acyltransferase [Stellaceae bacterium]